MDISLDLNNNNNDTKIRNKPEISPMPINIPERPTKRLLFSNSSVKPTLLLYTPLKKENSIPRYTIHGYSMMKNKF